MVLPKVFIGSEYRVGKRTSTSQFYRAADTATEQESDIREAYQEGIVNFETDDKHRKAGGFSWVPLKMLHAAVDVSPLR